MLPVYAYLLMPATNTAFLLRRVKEHRHYKEPKKDVMTKRSFNSIWRTLY